MRNLAKSYWMGVSLDGDRSKANVKSRFSPLCDDMTPEKAEILCDTETDEEKKIRARMVDNKTGRHFQAVRTLGRKTSSISLKPTA